MFTHHPIYIVNTSFPSLGCIAFAASTAAWHLVRSHDCRTVVARKADLPHLLGRGFAAVAVVLKALHDGGVDALGVTVTDAFLKKTK